MEILQYTPDKLKSVTNFYNRLIKNVPYCYPVSLGQFEHVLQDIIDSPEVCKDDELIEETVYIVNNKGTVEAYIHIGIESDDDKEYGGIIRFFGYRRGSREAGLSILKKAEESMRKYNVTRIYAFSKNYKYPFYHYRYAHLSNSLDHIEALLGLNGYKRVNGQVFLNWENFQVKPIKPKIQMQLKPDWKDGRGLLQNCNITAYKDGEEIGQCWTNSCGEFNDNPTIQDWVYIDWLGVEDEFQGKGLGKYLLEYTLQELKKVGYKHTTLSTSWDNHLAFLMYTNLGYRVIDWTYGYEKTFNDKSS
ncbi:hypothetical protein C6497_14960 [Candidatus Poribacteria bacterium]|nr:MAG: hypothetical protein C6497_14960 [Candidatus Poribacteria bacterium]